jgi:RNA ligase (TIGR02306 family)
MSTEHNVNVVRLGDIHKHDNADSLGITEVDGRPCIVRLGEYQPGDLAVYVPIDSLCPVADPRFAFLGEKHKQNAEGQVRLRAARLRGVFSMGLLVKPDADMVEGDEVRERMGIGIWEPDVRFGASPDSEVDPGFLPVYDIESARKWAPLVLEEGEEVVLTEKVHGANGRFAWHRDRLWCASRTRFPKDGPGEMWWTVAHALGLDEVLARFPGLAVYGEVYGQVQDLKYGIKGASLVVFDILDIAARRWFDVDEMHATAAEMGLPTVPVLYRGPWSPGLASLAEGPTVLGGGAHVREGWVLRPVKERHDHRLGRVLLKRHGEGYLTRKES